MPGESLRWRKVTRGFGFHNDAQVLSCDVEDMVRASNRRVAATCSGEDLGSRGRTSKESKTAYAGYVGVWHKEEDRAGGAVVAGCSYFFLCRLFSRVHVTEQNKPSSQTSSTAVERLPQGPQRVGLMGMEVNGYTC